MHKTLSCLGIALFLCSTGVGAEQKMVIHEWGTFTSLQNEAGEAIGGINTDDEPVPRFVHRLADLLLLPTEVPILYFQGAPSCHPDVTMRLETPVIYFHPPASQLNPESANIVVKFRGGWLTEYYPFAEAFAPGLKTPAATPDPRLDFFRLGPLRSSTESRLEWNSLKIGGRWPVTNTTEHVWLSPRAVKSALVRTTNGESEKFLFYRGVAHINAPLRISRDAGTGELVFRSQLGELPSDKPLPIRAIWLVDIQRDGKIAFRSLPPLALEPNTKLLTHTPPSFVRPEYSSRNLEKLRGSLHAALVADGLFADEADALLNTWELSYFKSAGLRVFFIVPRAWTDFYLPLEISTPAEISRVMVGRIELVTPEHRTLLQTIGRYSRNEITNEATRLRMDFYASSAVQPGEFQKFADGRKPLAASVSVPKTYQTYLDLGRFRNALVLDEAKRSSAEGLTNLIATYALEGYQPATPQAGP